MKDRILVCGSIAYDYLMNFDGLFKDSLSHQNLDALSISFLANEREKHFGGCGANISYSLALLGQKSILLSAVGGDFNDYDEWLTKNNVDTSFVARSSGELTASAYILSDKAENQMMIFSPGASGNTNLAMTLDGLPVEDIAYAIIGPDNPLRVFALVEECIRLDIPYIFDPGQITHILNEETLTHSIKNAKGLMANEFETKIIEEKLNIDRNSLPDYVDFFISTLGEKGSELFTKEGKQSVPAIKSECVIDPTGCGDAYRAGFLKGLMDEKELGEAVQMGTLMGTLVVSEKGTQKHSFDKEDFERYYSHAFK